jgi:hypothetical protein
MISSGRIVKGGITRHGPVAAEADLPAVENRELPRVASFTRRSPNQTI